VVEGEAGDEKENKKNKTSEDVELGYTIPPSLQASF
jgi:hypothetical protein